MMIDHQLLAFSEKVQKTVSVQQYKEIFVPVPKLKISQTEGAGR